MQKVKRKSGAKSEDEGTPKQRKVADESKGSKDNKKFSKATATSQNKKGKLVGKANLTKSKDGNFQKNKSSFQKGKAGGFQKGKVGGFQKGKDGGFQKGKDGAPTEKPVWSEMKKQKKELRVQRRKTKTTEPVFELSHKAKLLAAQIQKKTLPPSAREKLCTELHDTLKGHYSTIALTHDLSRVTQVVLKHATESIRIQVSEELMPIMAAMISSKYAHNTVTGILKHGTAGIRQKMIEKLYGHIVAIATHSVSAPVLDYAYGEYATNQQKLLMQQEFYGDIFKNTKDKNVKSLRDTFKDSPEMKEAILSTCKSNIQRVLDKNLHDGELLHSVLYQYMCECGAEERAELVTTLSPLIVPLSNSLPGVDAACLCVWQGTNKDKKTILKVVKEHAVTLSTHKTGYRLLLAIFDSVDDTVLVKKTIISALVKSLKDIAMGHWGKMTLHWLVKPGDPVAFHPALVKQLKEGASSGSSKKNPEARVAELREAVVPALCEEIKADPKFWMSDPTMALLTAAVLTTGPPKEVMSAIVNVICQADWVIKKDGADVSAIEDAGMHSCLKKLAQSDKDATDVTFGGTLAEELSDETLKMWLPTNRGCFVLLKAIESNSKEISSQLVDIIKPHMKLLENQKTPGAKLLLKNII